MSELCDIIIISYLHDSVPRRLYALSRTAMGYKEVSITVPEKVAATTMNCYDICTDMIKQRSTRVSDIWEVYPWNR